MIFTVVIDAKMTAIFTAVIDAKMAVVFTAVIDAKMTVVFTAVIACHGLELAGRLRFSSNQIREYPHLQPITDGRHLGHLMVHTTLNCL